MKIIVTTSNKYLHIVPIFCYLFNKNWSDKQQVELVGYDKPENLPDNFTFHSLGQQIGGAENFSTDLRKYFAEQDDWFIWLFEDSFIKLVDFDALEVTKKLIHEPHVGRINLTESGLTQENKYYGEIDGYEIYENTPTSMYRLSTQPSIWNKKFLLQYLEEGLTPWQFEKQMPFNDGWKILGLTKSAVWHNEGVTKRDIYKYNFDYVDEHQVREMKSLGII